MCSTFSLGECDLKNIGENSENAVVDIYRHRSEILGFIGSS
jgi:hypothetical protein